MDAQAYLMRHGWSGPGNPLNPNQRPGPHGGLGLTKPILVARKQNNHGVGKKTTKDPTNQWWLRGFEDALKGVGDESPAAVSAKANNALTSELYRFFVRGEGLAGTLDRKKVDAAVEKSQSKSKRKRDSDEEDVDRKARKEKAARKEDKRKRRKEGDSSDLTSSSDSSDKRKESKEERRLRRKEKKEKKARKADDSTAIADGSKVSLKKEKKAKRSAQEDYPTPMSTEQESEPARSKDEKSKKEKGEDRKSKKESKDKEKSDSKKKKSKKDKKEKISQV